LLLGEIMQWLVILFGGGLGSVSRALLSTTIYQYLGRAFPYGILIVNILGCMLMGFLAIILSHKFPEGGLWREGILVGFLGGFTTFSSFSLDTVEMIQEGMWLKGVLYIIASVVLCLLATTLGALLADRL
jgi:CrcB protein